MTIYAQTVLAITDLIKLIRSFKHEMEHNIDIEEFIVFVNKVYQH